MEFFSPQNEDTAPSKASFGSLWAIITLILLPVMCFLSIPAVIFAKEAKRLYKSGYYDLSAAFAKKAKRCTVSAWAIFVILSLALCALYFISRLSLI